MLLTVHSTIVPQLTIHLKTEWPLTCFNIWPMKCGTNKICKVMLLIVVAHYQRIITATPRSHIKSPRNDKENNALSPINIFAPFAFVICRVIFFLLFLFMIVCCTHLFTAIKSNPSPVAKENAVVVWRAMIYFRISNRYRQWCFNIFTKW